MSLSDRRLTGAVPSGPAPRVLRPGGFLPRCNRRGPVWLPCAVVLACCDTLTMTVRSAGGLSWDAPRERDVREPLPTLECEPIEREEIP